mgnify:CR=1 FL=1
MLVRAKQSYYQRAIEASSYIEFRSIRPPQQQIRRWFSKVHQSPYVFFIGMSAAFGMKRLYGNKQKDYMITLFKNFRSKGLYLIVVLMAFSFQTQAFDLTSMSKGSLLQKPTGAGFGSTEWQLHQTSSFASQSFFKNTAHRQHFLFQEFSNCNGIKFSLNEVGLYSAPKEERFSTKKSPLLAAGMNFFFPGLGYLYTGEQPLLTSLGMMAGAIGLTVVELQLQDQAPDLYPIMFGSVMVLNTSIAIVTFKNTRKNNERLGL